ncbi:unnamed protein product [Paramecium pentaurelia]|uniref:Protein kinase domain-containing protein n=1 Tax=Paramecium pentaurelia TaxID=43138 RepID=A0A8S1VW71_9CILI|nr:unnamed protein product [Paramecium pentaurelia]
MGLCSSNKNQKPIQQSQLIVSQPDQNNFKQSETQLTKQTKTAIPSIMAFQIPNLIKEDIDPPTPQSFRHSFSIIPEIKKSLEFKTGFFKTYSVITKNQDDNTLICQHNKTAELVLVYCMDPNNIQDQQLIKSIKQNQNDNNNICQFIEIFNENKTLYLVQEYCKGSKLSKLLNLERSKIIFIMSQLIQVLNQLNTHHLYHGKLTIDSFSLVDDQSYYVKLTDIRPIFQQNRNLETTKEIDEQNTYKRYQPPFEHHPSIKSDVFAMGIIFHQLLTEKLPEKIKIINNQPIWNPLLKLQNENDDKMKKLLKSMLQLDHIKRVSVQQLTQNKILSILNNKDLIQEILNKISICPSHNYFQTAILTFMIQKFQSQEYKIIKQLYQSLIENNDNYLQENQLEQICRNSNLNKVEFKIDHQETDNNNPLQNNSKRISEKDFLIALSNRDKLLTEENLETTYNQLKNSNGVLSVKSINRKIYIDQNQLLDDMEKISFNGQITINEFKDIMQLMK